MAKITVHGGPTNAADPDATPERADRTYAPMSDDEQAERLYGAYAEALDWQDGEGDLPNFEGTSDREQAAWRAVVRQARGDLLEPGGRQPAKRAPERDTFAEDMANGTFDERNDGGDRGPVDDNGAPYPQHGTAAEVESWVSGNSDRAQYALDAEALRDGGPRAGLSASLRKLVPAENDG